MSLTGHLLDPGSPVRNYFATTFPYVRSLRLRATEQAADIAGLPGARLPDHRPFPAPTVLPRADATSGPPWYPWGTAGTAFDYRLRYLLHPADPNTLVAAHGAQILTASAPTSRFTHPTSGGRPGRLWDELAAVLPGNATPAPRAGAEQDRALSRLCVLLAWFEQLYRMGPTPGWREHPLVAAGPDAALDDVLALVDDRVVADVHAMTHLLADRHPNLLETTGFRPNPTFARSADLGGADADLLLDGLLLEVKTNKTVTLRARVAWQMLGYLLADTDDEHHITHLGLYYARHGLLWKFPVQWFLNRLAGHTVDLGGAREEFAQVCRSEPRDAATAAALPRARVETPSAIRAGRRLPRPPSQRPWRPLPFYPPTSPGGMFHVLAIDVHPDLDKAALRRLGDQAACGNGIALDRNGGPAWPNGPSASAAARGAGVAVERMCRHCVAHLSRPPDPSPPKVLRFYPTADGRRWHVPANQTGYYFAGDGNAPACSTPALLNQEKRPLDVTAAQADAEGATPSAVQLCRRCVRILTQP